MPSLSETQQIDAKAEYEKNNLERGLGVSIGVPIPKVITNQLYSFIQYVKNNSAQFNNEQDKRFLSTVCENLRALDNAYANIINKLDNTAEAYLSEADLAIYLPAIESDVTSLTEARDSLMENRDTAQLRDTILRSGNGAVTNHQIYLLGRPLRPASIPLLWALSVLFVGFALLIFYTFYPYKLPELEVWLFDLYLLFADPFTWAILFSLASIVILFLSLRIAKIL